MNLFKLLNGNNYICFNREIAREIGIQAALMLSELVDRHSFYERMGKLEDGWFFLTVEEAEERIILAKEAQQNAIRKLADIGFVETKVKGLPAKRHFRLNVEIIIDWISGAETKPSRTETNHPVGRKPANCEDGKPPTTPIYEQTKEETNKQNAHVREAVTVDDLKVQGTDIGTFQERLAFLKEIQFPDMSRISQRNIETWTRNYSLWRMKKAVSQFRRYLETGKEIDSPEALFATIIRSNDCESNRQIEKTRDQVYELLCNPGFEDWFIDGDFVVNKRTKKEFKLDLPTENILNELTRGKNAY